MGSRKSLAVAQYIIDRCQEKGDASVTPMQILKLVYAAHGFMLGRHGKPLLDEPVQAWQYGPVVPSVYHAVKQYRSNPVSRVAGAENVDFSENEMAIMNLVADNYGQVDGITLSRATHQPGTPWRQTWEIAGNCNAEISNDLIENFYVGLLKQKSLSSL